MLDRQGHELFCGGELEEGGSYWQTTDADGTTHQIQGTEDCLQREIDRSPGSQAPFRSIEWNQLYTIVWENDQFGRAVKSYTYDWRDELVVITYWQDGKPLFDQTYALDRRHSDLKAKPQKMVYVLSAVHLVPLYQGQYLHFVIQPDGKTILTAVLSKQREWTEATLEAYQDKDLPSNHIHNDSSQGLIVEGKTVWTFRRDGSLLDVSVFNDANVLSQQTVWDRDGNEHGKGIKKTPVVSLKHRQGNGYGYPLSRKQLDRLPDADPKLTSPAPGSIRTGSRFQKFRLNQRDHASPTSPGFSTSK